MREAARQAANAQGAVPSEAWKEVRT